MQTHFKRFNDAIQDLSNFINREIKASGDNPANVPDYIRDMMKLSVIGVGGIKTGQRFYLPSGNSILEDKVLTPDLKELIRLPYDCIAILGECPLYMNMNDLTGYTGSTWTITIAFDIDGPFNKAVKAVAQSPHENMAIGIVSLVLTTVEGVDLWVPCPGIVLVEYPPSGNGYNLLLPEMVITKKWQEQSNSPVHREFLNDISAVNTLCTMLNLQNVKSKNVKPDDALQKKRTRHGQLPLYSYRVLVVDNEEWGDLGRSHRGDGNGTVRSHMRRGHIRKLHDSERRVWVRATFVHGRSAGIIEKDYQMAIK